MEEVKKVREKKSKLKSGVKREEFYNFYIENAKLSSLNRIKYGAF